MVMEKVKDRVQVQNNSKDYTLNHCTALHSWAHFDNIGVTTKLGSGRCGPCSSKAHSGFLCCSCRLPMIVSLELRWRFLVPGPPPPHSPCSLLSHSLEVLLLTAIWALVLLWSTDYGAASPFYRWADWGPERVNDLSNYTQPISGSTRNKIEISWFLIQGSSLEMILPSIT